MALFYLSPLSGWEEGGPVEARCCLFFRGSKNLCGKGAGEPKTWPINCGGQR